MISVEHLSRGSVSRVKFMLICLSIEGPGHILLSFSNGRQAFAIKA